MNQQGVTFLEIVVVIAILMITSAMVAPSIQDWRQKRALESDFQAVLAKIDYLKTRTRSIAGTGLLICSANGTALAYQISTHPQTSIRTLDDDENLVEEKSKLFTKGIVEGKGQVVNILSGKTKLDSPLCENSNSSRGIFVSDGRSGVENSKGGIEITISLESDPVSGGQYKYGAYKIYVYQNSGFIKKEVSIAGKPGFFELD